MTDSEIRIDKILEVLPHRYPMLLVDRIVSMDPGKQVVGYKNVTINEAFFQGHYPGMPVMPGVLIIESMAQVGAIMLLQAENLKGLIPLIGAIDDVKFKKIVTPGDQLVSTIDLLWLRGTIGKLKGLATVDGEFVASMELIFKLKERTF